MPYRTNPPVSIGPSPSFRFANDTLPRQAGESPISAWHGLADPSAWGWVIATEGGTRVIVRDRFELVVVCLPTPTAAGEPHFAVLARRAGELHVRCFVFERGANPDGMAMAELRYQSATGIQRLPRPLESAPTLERCIERTVVVMRDPRTEARPVTRRSSGDSSHDGPLGVLGTVLDVVLGFFSR